VCVEVGVFYEEISVRMNFVPMIFVLMCLDIYSVGGMVVERKWVS
jgi:hypothetical protein